MARAYRATARYASPAETEPVALAASGIVTHGGGMIVDTLAMGSLFAPLGRLGHEVAAVAYVDARRGLLGLRHLAGARNWCQLPIRLVARDALAFEARGVILAHNHPSGHAEASAADLAFTRRLALCLEALDVHLLDHLVVAGDRMTSLRAEGFL